LGEDATGEGAERANGGDFERHIDNSISNCNSGIQMKDGSVDSSTNLRVEMVKGDEERENGGRSDS
jgi:hypothetical protein